MKEFWLNNTWWISSWWDHLIQWKSKVIYHDNYFSSSLILTSRNREIATLQSKNVSHLGTRITGSRISLVFGDFNRLMHSHGRNQYSRDLEFLLSFSRPASFQRWTSQIGCHLSPWRASP
jgi:hypothetical protein